MKPDDPIGPVEPGTLRDHADAETVRRIWQRIEPELPARPRRRERPLVWVPAAALAVFGAGVLVGARWFSESPAPVAAVTAEPAPVAEPASAPQPAERVRVEPEKRAPARSVRRTKPAPVPPEPSAALSPAPPVEAALPLVSMPEPVEGPPLWQRLADDGHYQEALAAIEEQGGFDAVLNQATAEQLMLLQDVARATSQRDRAIYALRQVVSKHGSDPNASVAAWMLGNELAKAGDAHGAAQAFAMYRALSPQGDFAEDALAREFEVAIEQGDVDHARRLAEQYAKDFPDGPRLADIRAQLDREARNASDRSGAPREEPEARKPLEADPVPELGPDPPGDTR